MSLNTAVTLTGASLGASGGTAVNWSSLGQRDNKNLLVVTADTDLRTRRQIDVVVKPPVPLASAPNGYSQARVMGIYRKPILLANGKITVCTASVQISYDVEASASVVQDLLDTGAQILFDNDFTPSFKTLSLA